ncbi:hypothetical protein LINPERHAP1_LOCUS38071 [Linum perenne]
MERSTMIIATIGILVILVNGLRVKGGNNVTEHFQCRWNATTFDPHKHPGIRSCIDAITPDLESHNSTALHNRDRMVQCPEKVARPSLFFWFTCRHGMIKSDCRKCLKSAALKMNKCCLNSYGVDVKSRNCEVRYETYPFMM